MESRNVGSNGSKKKILLVLLPLVLIAGLAAVAAVFPSASNQGYGPEQPIPFSHKLHAGTNKIACIYCHASAERSIHATVPSLNVCMNCHRVVKTDSPWIKQIKEHYDSNRPIEWVRIHELPDFVHFTHKRHVAKGISCQTCHGPVQEMERVYQYAPLNMGWCLDCHRGQTTPPHILAETYPGDKNPQGKPVAPIACSTCHY